MSRSIRFHGQNAKNAKHFIKNLGGLNVFAVQNSFSTKRWQLGLIILALSGCAASPPSPTPQPLAHYLGEASVQVEAGKAGEATHFLENAAQAYPDSALPLTQLGQIYLTRRQWRLAEDAFNRALARDLDNPLAMAGLAEVYLNQSRPFEALKLWQQATEADPNLAGVFTGLGRTWLHRLDFDKARFAFLEQQTHRPDPEAAWYLAALDAPLDLAKARAYLSQIPDDVPPNLVSRREYLLTALEPFEVATTQATVAQAIGVALVQAELWPLAINALTIAESLPGQPAAEQAKTLAFLAHARAQAGQPAFDLFEEAQQLDPHSALPDYFQGIYLRQKGALGAAGDLFRQALKLDPANPAIYLELARTYIEQGDLGAAEETFKAAVEAAPEDKQIQLLQARFYASRSYRLEEAGIPLAKALVEADRDNAAAHELLGWMQFLTGEADEAGSHLRQAVEIDPESVSAAYHLARFLESGSTLDEAQSLYQRALELDSNGVFREEIWQGLQRLEQKTKRDADD